MKEKLRLCHYSPPEANVGDDLNITLWPHFFGDVFGTSAPTLFIGIGSLLDHRYDGPEKKIVFGSGARNRATAPAVHQPNWDVRFVRGPLTAHALNLPEAMAISDPAILAPLVYTTAGIRSPCCDRIVGFIPYFRTDPVYAHLLSNRAGLLLISPTLKPERFIAKLRECTHVITEAMHGAILADAYRIPWYPCRISNISHEGSTHDFKWADWMQSLNVESDFMQLPAVWSQSGKGLLEDIKLLAKVQRGAKLLRKQANSARWVLSETEQLGERQEQIRMEIANLQKDLK